MSETQEQREEHERFQKLKLGLGPATAPMSFEFDAPSPRYYSKLNEIISVLPLLLSKLITGEASVLGEQVVRYTSVSTVLTESDDILIVDATAGAVIVSLPTASNTGKQYIIVKIDDSANTVTINVFGNDTIEGGSSVVLSSQYDKTILVSGGVATWLKLSTGLV